MASPTEEKKPDAATNGNGSEKKGPSVMTRLAGELSQLKTPTETGIFKSIFRHKLDGKPRTRSLAVLSNVFLHLHPAKITPGVNRHTR